MKRVINALGFFLSCLLLIAVQQNLHAQPVQSNNILNGTPDESGDGVNSALGTLDLTYLINGFYGGGAMSGKMITVNLRLFTSPSTSISSYIVTLDNNGHGLALFPGLTYSTITEYYIQITHRNTIETWSSDLLANRIKFPSAATVFYDFTGSSSMAYGNNMEKIGTKWCAYGGNLDPAPIDCIVDSEDIFEVYNHQLTAGDVIFDLDGDDYVDVSDLIIVWNDSQFPAEIISPSVCVICESGIVCRE